MKTRTLTNLATVALFLAVFVDAAAAATGDPAATAPTGRLLETAAGVLVAALTPIVVALGALLAAKLRAATKLDLTAQIERGADLAIGYAEQLARQHAAKLGAKLPGSAKLDLALEFLMPIAERQGWPAWAKARAAQFVEAQLGRFGAGAFAQLDTATPAAPAAPPAAGS